MNHSSDAFAHVVDHARGVFYGQVIDDNPGALVKFCSAEEIAQRHPYSVCELVDGGIHNIVVGQSTDDSEMMPVLARSLVHCESCGAADVHKSCVRQANSDTSGIGKAITAALLRRVPNPNSQASSALMHILPLAIVYWRNPARVDELVCRGAATTHLHPVRIEANSRYVFASADIASGGLHQSCRGIGVNVLIEWLTFQRVQQETEQQTSSTVVDSGESGLSVHQGQLRFALWTLREELHRVEDKITTSEDSLIRVIGCGDDIDTNATTVGAFLGGVLGASGIPQRWRDIIDSCSSKRD